ncbi:putative uncharacterized protein DDB_G0282133 [Diaphorina citri]|uniref:Uncharacterized protein n=1 Tax=Diaphorina citri TaxID=121845 RepID=A0A3Q0J0E9_DIACI|nr:putative uncharacterized protein DDB_G0282133 [Diaphorina citri]
MYLRASVNTTLVDLDRFKLPRSDESMMDNMVTYNDPMPEPDNKDKREKILADYFSGDSSSRGDSHMNTFEFYDELRRVDFDFTKNKKLLAIFERRTIRNETISRIIDEKMNAKLEEKAEVEEKEEEKEKRRLKKKTTKSRLDALIEDIERMSTRSRKLDLPVTKIPWRSGKKTASDELRQELEQINEAKNKVVGRKRKAKGKTNKTGSVKKKTAKSKFKLVKVNTNVDDAHEHFQKILNKYTLPEVTRADHIPGSDEIPITGELFTLKDYDLKDFGFNMDGETNQTQVQSKIIYKSEMAGELEEKELRAENVEGKRQKRHVENISKNNENINKHKIDDKYNSKHHKNNMTTLETKSGFHGNKSSVHHGLKDFGFANNETEKNGEKEHDQNNGEDKNKSKMVINFLQNIIQNSKKIKKNSENQTNTDDKSISFENDPNIKHYEIDDADLKKFGMEFDENDPNKVMVSRILYESELSEETKKEMKADNEKMEREYNTGRSNTTDRRRRKRQAQNCNNNNNTSNNSQNKNTSNNSSNKNKNNNNFKRNKRHVLTDEEILQKYTKKINNIAVRKRFKYTRKNAAGNLGLLDEKQLRAQYNESDDDIPGSVSVISVEYDANVLNRIMEHNRDIAKNFRQNNRDLGNIIDTHQCQKTGHCRCIGTNGNITEGFELEVENVHFTTTKKQMSNNLQKGKNRESKADSEESDSAFKAMNKMADHNLNPAAMFQSFDSDQRDESFYKDDDEKTNTTGGVPSHEMLDLSKMNDSEIESFILRKEAATRQANLLRDLIVTTASTGRVYKTRRTYNRRILVNCTGYVGDLRFKLLIPKKLKRTQGHTPITVKILLVIESDELRFKRGEYNVQDYAEYLGLDPKDFFNGETPPFKVEPMPVFEHGKGHDMFDNQTDFTYLEYEMTTDPFRTLNPRFFIRTYLDWGPSSSEESVGPEISSKDLSCVPT